MRLDKSKIYIQPGFNVYELEAYINNLGSLIMHDFNED